MKRNCTVFAMVVLSLALTPFLLGSDAEESTCDKASITFDNDFFYKEDGAFDPEKARDAYIAMMEYHGYPVFEGMREKIWVSDYGTGQFAKLGLGAYGFINDEKGGYLGQDMFLLPNQMLPEHYHIKTEKPAKMEGWHVRHGEAYVYGEGEPTKDMKAVIPKCHMDGKATVYHEKVLKEGQTAVLERETARHWMFGGPEGAVVSEYGRYHDNAGVFHSDPKLVFP
ncbi:MAG: cupin domain-containing protein [Planctomycetota bacterium]|jgi:D-lyxose ketol-isomerase